jgi:catechol 2,3-dioxygenase-like lactoylglutathione lyase family enzyme
MTMPAPGFPDRGIGPVRLGHLAIMASNPDKVVQFYRDALGLQITDWFEEFATFMTCNPDHHVIVIVQGN